MGKRFNEYIERKISKGTLYQHTLAGNDVCGNCIYRRPWQNLCSKFNKPIEKRTHGGRYTGIDGRKHNGFYHLPCQECLNYKIQRCDVQYYINAYKKRNPYKLIGIDINKKMQDIIDKAKGEGNAI